MKKNVKSVGATIGRPKNRCEKMTANGCRHTENITPNRRGEHCSSDKKNSRRGFTIVELVVALVVIVLVTVISIGVVAVDNKTHGETIDMIEATNIAENAIECFRYAVNNSGGNNVTEKTNFENCFAKSINVEFDPSDDNKTYPFAIPSESVDNVYTYTYTDNRITVTIKLTDSDADRALDTITVSASSPSDENLIEPKTYMVR